MDLLTQLRITKAEKEKLFIEKRKIEKENKELKKKIKHLQFMLKQAKKNVELSGR